MDDNVKVAIIVIVALVLMVFGVIFFNHITSDKDKDLDTIVEIEDVNNVPTIDAKLGEDIRITQSYLMNYTIKKSSIWYMSSAYVKSVKTNGTLTTISLAENKNSKGVLLATIDSKNANITKNMLVNFVGTIDLETGDIDLAKISENTIDYKNVTEIEFKELLKNIELVKSNYFVISGFMITDEKEYKLYDSKEDYKNDNDLVSYFLINWKEAFGYTGNQEVKIKCQIADTYVLKNCELVN